MKLFVIYIGGRTAQSMIELHDMRFVFAETIEQTFPELKKTWWGTPSSLHLDCWGELKFADGYEIRLSTEASPNPQKLYFVNLGGYSTEEFTELHKNIFLVAENEAEAKKKALIMARDWKQGHKDNLYEIETVISLNQIAAEKSIHLDLVKSENTKSLQFEFGYLPIGKKS